MPIAESPEQSKARGGIDRLRTQVRMVLTTADAEDGAARAALLELADRHQFVRDEYVAAFGMESSEALYELGRLFLEEGQLRFQLRQEDEAVSLDRGACLCFRGSTKDAVDPRHMHHLVLGYRSLAVACAVTQRLEEARFAAGTGLANAGAAMKEWPSIDLFAEEHRSLTDLAAKLGGDCPVFISDDPASWPFGDQED